MLRRHDKFGNACVCVCVSMNEVGARLSLACHPFHSEYIFVAILNKHICLCELIASVHRKNNRIGDLYFSFIQNSNGGCFNQPDGALCFPPLQNLRWYLEKILANPCAHHTPYSHRMSTKKEWKKIISKNIITIPPMHWHGCKIRFCSLALRFRFRLVKIIADIFGFYYNNFWNGPNQQRKNSHMFSITSMRL